MPFADGRIEAVQGALPEPAIRAFAYVTDLGDPLFVVVVLAATYLFVDYRWGGFLVGVASAGYGLTVALKELLAVPRPPAELHVVEASGYGPPSGHALGTAVVFGVLAVELDVGTPRQRYAVAAVLVGVVSVSRIVTGVHYVADVVAGLLLGVGILVVIYRFEWKRPLPLFGIGVVGGLAGIVLSGLTYAVSFVVFGLALGGLLTWYLATPLLDPGPRASYGVGAVALPLSVFLVPVGPSPPITALTVVPAAAVGMAVILAAPNVAAWLETAGTIPGQ